MPARVDGVVIDCRLPMLRPTWISRRAVNTWMCRLLALAVTACAGSLSNHHPGVPLTPEFLARHPWEGFSDAADWLAIRLEISADGTGRAATLRHVHDPVRDPADAARAADELDRRQPRRWRIDRVTFARWRLEIRMTSEDDQTVWTLRGKAVALAPGLTPTLLLCVDALLEGRRCHAVRLHPEVRMSGRLHRLQAALEAD